jgi:hypothetical protein
MRSQAAPSWTISDSNTSKGTKESDGSGKGASGLSPLAKIPGMLTGAP